MQLCCAQCAKSQLDQITRATVQYESVEAHADESRATKSNA